MKTKPHPYFEKATYLLIISALLGLIETFFDDKIKEYNIVVQSITIALTVVLMIFIIYSVWQEKYWTKIALPVFAIIGIVSTLFEINKFFEKPIYFILDILSNIFFIAGTVYVLKAPKKVKEG